MKEKIREKFISSFILVYNKERICNFIGCVFATICITLFILIILCECLTIFWFYRILIFIIPTLIGTIISLFGCFVEDRY